MAENSYHLMAENSVKRITRVLGLVKIQQKFSWVKSLLGLI